MFKRAFWLTAGTLLGFGSSWWVQRAVRRTVERYAPERVTVELTNAARGLGQEVRAAVSEGRDAMRDREAQLRAELVAARPGRVERRTERRRMVGGGSATRR